MTEKELFFKNDFRTNFTWKDGSHLRGGTVRPDNQEQIAKGLQDLSKESIRNRFLGSKRAFSPQELRYLTEIDGLNHYAFGLEEQKAPHRGVGIIRLVRSSMEPAEGEIAITIIDDYQKMGLGRFLMNVIICAAIERGIKTLSFSFLPHNTGIEKLVHSFGATKPGLQTKDFVQLYMDLEQIDLQKVKSQLAPYLPQIEIFHSKI